MGGREKRAIPGTSHALGQVGGKGNACSSVAALAVISGQNSQNVKNRRLRICLVHGRNDLAARINLIQQFYKLTPKAFSALPIFKKTGGGPLLSQHALLAVPIKRHMRQAAVSANPFGLCMKKGKNSGNVFVKEIPCAKHRLCAAASRGAYSLFQNFSRQNVCSLKITDRAGPIQL